MLRTLLTIILLSQSCLVLAQPKAHAVKEQPTPIVLGSSYELWSAELGEKRTLNVYFPADYKASDTTRYPVIYLLDGGVDEDFIHVAGLVQFNTFEWVNRAPKSIVVGIVNVDRKRDFTYPTASKSDKAKFPTTGGSAKFIAFLEKELQPYVNNKFRTRGPSTLIGESLGGLLATEILFTKPGLFDKYVIISPSLWWDDGSLLKRPLNIAGKKDIYIAVGKEGLTPGEVPHVMEVDANLLENKIESLHNKDIRVFLDYLPDENHATIAHQALLNALKRIYVEEK